MNARSISDRLDALEGQALALLTVCQVIALRNGQLTAVAGDVRKLAEIQQSRLLGNPIADAAIEAYQRVITKFLDGLPPDGAG
jgi:hypothetical protein